jgi:hypothetical protein
MSSGTHHDQLSPFTPAPAGHTGETLREASRLAGSSLASGPLIAPVSLLHHPARRSQKSVGLETARLSS